MAAGRILAALLFLSLGAAFSAAAQDHMAGHGDFSDFDEDAALAYSQAAVGRVAGDYSFLDRRSKPIKISDFRGRPLIVSLIYTSCYHICPMLTQNLARVVELAREALGEDSFAVATIGFDTKTDTPTRMRYFAREQGIDLPGWMFLSTDAETIDNLARDLGFIYYPSPKGFDHLAQTTILDAEGQVYRQVYGENFTPPHLVEPLKQLVFGAKSDVASLSGWINGVRLFCTIYDPSSGRYRFDYSLFVGIAVGIVVLGSIAVYLVIAWRKTKPPKSDA